MREMKKKLTGSGSGLLLGDMFVGRSECMGDFEFFTTVLLKIQVFKDLMLRCWVKCYVALLGKVLCCVVG
jgi:hypothetical protein